MCECCLKPFKSARARNTHIGKIKECKDFYGVRFEQMRKDNKREQVKAWRKKTGNKRRLAKQREEYAVNPEKKREYSKNRARETKLDSNANLAKFHQDIEFGPEFICICCHAALDENEVLELDKKREEKIGPILLESCCEKREKDFNDPREKG